VFGHARPTWQWGKGLLQLPQGSPSRRRTEISTGLDPAAKRRGSGGKPCVIAGFDSQQHHRPPFSAQAAAGSGATATPSSAARRPALASLPPRPGTRPAARRLAQAAEPAAPGPCPAQTNHTKDQSHQDGSHGIRPGRNRDRFGPRQGWGAATIGAEIPWSSRWWARKGSSPEAVGDR